MTVYLFKFCISVFRLIGYLPSVLYLYRSSQRWHPRRSTCPHSQTKCPQTVSGSRGMPTTTQQLTIQNAVSIWSHTCLSKILTCWRTLTCNSNQTSINIYSGINLMVYWKEIHIIVYSFTNLVYFRGCVVMEKKQWKSPVLLYPWFGRLSRFTTIRIDIFVL